ARRGCGRNSPGQDRWSLRGSHAARGFAGGAPGSLLGGAPLRCQDAALPGRNADAGRRMGTRKAVRPEADGRHEWYKLLDAPQERRDVASDYRKILQKDRGLPQSRAGAALAPGNAAAGLRKGTYTSLG